MIDWYEALRYSHGILLRNEIEARTACKLLKERRMLWAGGETFEELCPHNIVIVLESGKLRYTRNFDYWINACTMNEVDWR